MLLRHVIEHVKAQNWTAVGLDFVIVVVGVFVGLQVQEWAQERGRRQMEASYTERLHEEVVDLQAVRAPLIEIRNRWQGSLDAVKPVLFGELERPITDNECQAIALSYAISNPTDDLASLIELQSSGRLSLLQQEGISKALRSFLLTRARARDSGAGIATSVKQLPSDYAQLIRVSSPSQIFGVPAPASFVCDEDAMRTDPSFINDYEINQANFAFHVRDNARVSESLAELHRALDEALDLDHEEPAQ